METTTTMAFIKHTLKNHQFEINTDLGDEISVRVIDMKNDAVIADYSKSIAEEIVTLLESKYAHRSLIEIICLSAESKIQSESPSFPIHLTDNTDETGAARSFSAN